MKPELRHGPAPYISLLRLKSLFWALMLLVVIVYVFAASWTIGPAESLSQLTPLPPAAVAVKHNPNLSRFMRIVWFSVEAGVAIGLEALLLVSKRGPAHLVHEGSSAREREAKGSRGRQTNADRQQREEVERYVEREREGERERETEKRERESKGKRDIERQRERESERERERQRLWGREEGREGGMEGGRERGRERENRPFCEIDRHVETERD